MFLYRTDHLCDRELYTLLWDGLLREETTIMPPDPDNACHLDVIGSGSEEDVEIGRNITMTKTSASIGSRAFPEIPSQITRLRPMTVISIYLNGIAGVVGKTGSLAKMRPPNDREVAACRRQSPWDGATYRMPERYEFKVAICDLEAGPKHQVSALRPRTPFERNERVNAERIGREIRHLSCARGVPVAVKHRRGNPETTCMVGDTGLEPVASTV